MDSVLKGLFVTVETLDGFVGSSERNDVERSNTCHRDVVVPEGRTIVNEKGSVSPTPFVGNPEDLLSFQSPILRETS